MLYSSRSIRNILDGTPLSNYKCIVNKMRQRQLYVILDGIYLLNSISVVPDFREMAGKASALLSAQTPMQKDADKPFGVCFSRWALLSKRCTFMDRSFEVQISQVDIIQKNMMVEAGKDGYESNLWAFAELATERCF